MRFNKAITVGFAFAVACRSGGVGAAEIEGADFSSALFSIWLAERGFDDSARRQLLASR